MSEAQFIFFLVTSMFVILTPGQDMFLVMSRSVALGKRAGVVTAAGVSAGLLGHTILAVCGLGAVLKTSALLFTAIKLAGAGYLLWLGFNLLRSKGQQLQLAAVEEMPLHKLFLQGAISNIANPKIAIFYFSFLPQFISAELSNPAYILLILGTIFALLTFCLKAPIGFAAGSLADRLRAKPAIQLWLNRCSGIILMALGLRLAFSERS